MINGSRKRFPVYSTNCWLHSIHIHHYIVQLADVKPNNYWRTLSERRQKVTAESAESTVPSLPWPCAAAERCTISVATVASASARRRLVAMPGMSVLILMLHDVASERTLGRSKCQFVLTVRCVSAGGRATVARSDCVLLTSRRSIIPYSGAHTSPIIPYSGAHMHTSPRPREHI